jgi:hypothetical protein
MHTVRQQIEWALGGIAVRGQTNTHQLQGFLQKSAGFPELLAQWRSLGDPILDHRRIKNNERTVLAAC